MPAAAPAGSSVPTLDPLIKFKLFCRGPAARSPAQLPPLHSRIRLLSNWELHADSLDSTRLDSTRGSCTGLMELALPELTCQLPIS
jgi:hypothetical protein